MTLSQLLDVLDKGGTLALAGVWIFMLVTERLVPGSRVRRLEAQLERWEQRTLRALRLTDRGVETLTKTVEILEEDPV